ncbi:MAG: hypothetical protein Q8M16_04805 [Pirellulaceae bacterium]|nr:hypothetical protein [Pirellulaceae bacterium]
MAGSEEHLFRQFRLPWVPSWVPDWLEAVLRAPWAWKLVAITLLSVAISYFAWTQLESRTGQESVDLAAWESRLAGATNAELPVLLDSLFQMQNDAAMAMGIRQLTGRDPIRRQLAGLALQDSHQQWTQWPPENASRQRERVVRLLAQIVGGLHAPEQVIAVELARQTLLQPAPMDSTIRDSLLANSRILFAQAHPAHTGAARWEDSSSSNRIQGFVNRGGAERPGSDPNWPTADQRTNPVASNQSFPNNDTTPSGNQNSNRFRPAGFSRSSAGKSGNSDTTPMNQRRIDNRPRTSQIPLFDGEGRLIEVEPIDPTDTSTPGGLIPVGMSGSARLPKSSSVPQSELESGYRESAESSTNRSNRIGGSRTSSPENMADHSGSHTIPGRSASSPTDEENRKRELANAFQLRAQSVSATRQRPSDRVQPNRNERSRLKPDTEIVTSEPSPVPQATAPVPPDQPNIRAATPRLIPQNPYRAGNSTASENLQPIPEATAELGMNWESMSHIEVMFRLRDRVPEIAQQAAKELDRRGFNSDYVAVARRLTSPDPRERMQLVLDLVASQRVEPTPFLRWLANDPDLDVQSLAIDALEMLQSSVQNRGADALSEARRRR